MASRALVRRLTDAVIFDFSAVEALLQVHDGTGSIAQWMATPFVAEFIEACTLPWWPLDQQVVRTEMERAIMRLPPLPFLSGGPL